MIFGSVKQIAALDAAPLEQLNMILLLSINGSLLLYTGVTKYVLSSKKPIYEKEKNIRGKV
jgi:hypothetical protein